MPYRLNRPPRSVMSVSKKERPTPRLFRLRGWGRERCPSAKIPRPVFKLLTGGQKMNIKSLLLGSAAALVAVSGARAADAVIAPEPEPVEYVRVCDVYGTSFYYIPGTEICLKIGGYWRYDIGAGDLFGQIGDEGDETWSKRARFQLRVDARTETELGTLRGYFAYNFQWQTVQEAVPGVALVDTTGDGVPDLVAPGTTNLNSTLTNGIEHAYVE